MSINKRIDKQIVAGLYNQILLRNIDDNIDESPEYWGVNEAKLKMYISYGYIYMKFPEWAKLISCGKKSK